MIHQQTVRSFLPSRPLFQIQFYLYAGANMRRSTLHWLLIVIAVNTPGVWSQSALNNEAQKTGAVPGLPSPDDPVQQKQFREQRTGLIGEIWRQRFELHLTTSTAGARNRIQMRQRNMPQSAHKRRNRNVSFRNPTHRTYLGRHHSHDSLLRRGGTKLPEIHKQILGWASCTWVRSEGHQIKPRLSSTL
jgi:hypothetical protein